MKSEGVYVGAVAGIWFRPIIEDPEDLPVLAVREAVGDIQQLTQTMERRMKPAAAASLAPLLAYTKELTADVVKTRPAARKPTIWGRVSMVEV